MGKVITDGHISIGYGTFSNKKKPCLCVTLGNECFVLGTFKNEINAEFFIDKLAEMTRAKEETDREEE